MGDWRCLAVKEEVVGGGLVVLQAGEEVALAGLANPPRAGAGDRPTISKGGVVGGDVGLGGQRSGQDAADGFLGGRPHRLEQASEVRRPRPGLVPTAWLHAHRVSPASGPRTQTPRLRRLVGGAGVRVRGLTR